MKKVLIFMLVLLCGCGRVSAPPPRRVRAVVVPHHNIALMLAEDIFSPLADYNPKTIILVGPNHTASGPRIASTSAGAKFSRLIGADDELIENEHSIGSLLPLIEKYFPNADVIPIIFQKGASFVNSKEVMSLAFAEPDALIIASIDFSHGLLPHEEEVNRARISEYIKSFDSSAIMALDKTYLDAPVVLAALLDTAKENGVTSADIVASTNAAEVLGMEVPDATGYLTIVFQ